MASDIPRLSVIIPAYNESGRVGATIERIQDYFAQQEYGGEIVVVDDGSTDGTADYVRQQFPGVTVVAYAPNRGKGFAVKRGVEVATGAYRLCYDADGSTPIEEIEKVWPKTDAGAEVVIGSRALPDSDVAVHQPWYRENMGRIYNLILRILRLTEFPDTQCGFKVFSARAAQSMFPLQTMDGYGADCELLVIAKLHGLNVDQVPVRWLNSPDTRVHPIIDSLKMLREAMGVKWNALRGKYNPVTPN